jgi:hypothetical protein
MGCASSTPSNAKKSTHAPQHHQPQLHQPRLQQVQQQPPHAAASTSASPTGDRAANFTGPSAFGSYRHHVPCRYFAQGNCILGNACEYLHDRSRARRRADDEGWQTYDPVAFGERREYVDDDAALARAIEESLATAPPALPAQQTRTFTSAADAPFTEVELVYMAKLAYSPVKAAEASQSNASCGDQRDLTSCAVCFEEYEMHADLMVLPCLHRFHWTCGASWLKRSPQCPVCNTNPKLAGGSPDLLG